MVDINSKTEQVRVNVSSVGNKGNVSFIPTQNYYDGLAKQWAVSDKLVNGEDYSSKHYAGESKKQADLATEKAMIATNKVDEVVESGNEALSKISAQETASKNAVKTEGDTQVARVKAEGANYATKAEATYTAGDGISIENNVISSTDTDLKNKLEVQNMYTTGLVSEDAQGYNQLLSMKRSTFDKSKFTVVGSPTITDDGVASGFKKGNDLNFPAITVTDNSTIVIRTKIKTVPRASSSDTQGQCIFGFYKNDTSEYIDTYNLWNGANITLGYKHKGVDKAQGISVPTVPNTEYDYKVEITKNAIKCYLDGELKGQQLNLSFDMSLINNVIGSIGTGARKGLTPTRMKIYLPDFSITVDGKEVFSGNKTGIDTIKADNYEVVGNPVISNDGIVSGFSSSNYIKTPTVPELGKITESIRFTSSFVYNTLSEQTIWNKDLNFDFRLNNGAIILRTHDGTKANVFSIPQSQHKVTDGAQAFCDVVITSSLCSIKINGVEFTKIQVTDFSYLINAVNKVFRIGMSNAFDLYFKKSIDLNAFKIYVDVNLVYQPCLKIPYTQSKTGSKIVDGGYRDRLQDVYEQFGTASYYTLDETNQNFTLPMGEIYGMLEQKNNMLNNPFTFGMSQYYKGEMENLSWLKSIGQEYFKSGHPDFYNWVLTNANAGKEGFKLSTASDITDYDFVVNPTKETFRLPLKNGMEGVFANTTAPVVGNGNGIGLVSTTNEFNNGGARTMSCIQQPNYMNGLFINNNYTSSPKSVGSSQTSYTNNQTVIGLTKNSELSGMYADLSNVTVPSGYNLYYYVGETVEGANIIKAGEVWEEISNKLDTPPRYVVEVSDKSLMPSWYVVYNDGWCEQGGKGVHSSSNQQVSLLKTMANTNYQVFVQWITSNYSSYFSLVPANLTTTTFTISSGTQADSKDFEWQTCGYIR